MESMKSFHDHLENLQSQAKKLTETGLVLNGLFAEEETRLHREDEVSTLKAVYDAIAERLQRLKYIEASASCGHSQGNAILSLIELAAKVVVSKNNRPSAIKDYLLRDPNNRKQPFGLVMICVGPKGLPDGVEIVSISPLARESNRLEPQIINKLQEDGYLLFSQEAFSALIDELIGDVREGRLSMPISRDKLAEIAGLNKPKPRIKVIKAE
jgi:hypothetical protein